MDNENIKLNINSNSNSKSKSNFNFDIKLNQFKRYNNLISKYFIFFNNFIIF